MQSERLFTLASRISFKKKRSLKEGFSLPFQCLAAILDEVNSNNVILSTDEVLKTYKELKLLPVNLNHEQFSVIGVTTTSDVKYPQEKKAELWVSGIIWSFLYPDIGEYILQEQSVPVSLEFFVEKAQCFECNEVYDYVQYKLGNACEHLKEGAPAILKGLTFAGIAILLPPKVPAVKEAEIKETEETRLPEPEEIKKFSDKELLDTHEKVHAFWEEEHPPFSAEEIFNTHLFIVEELKRRKIEHEIRSSLDTIKLTRVNQEAEFIEKLISGLKEAEKIPVIPKIVSIVGSVAKENKKPEDIDFAIRLAGDPAQIVSEIEQTIALQIRNVLRRLNINLQPHFIPTLTGAHDTNYPVYDLVLSPSKIEKESFGKQIPKFTPLKTAGGYGEHTFSISDLSSFWEIWAKGYIEEGLPLIVEEKFDGFRVVAIKVGDELTFRSEDTEHSLNKYLPSLVSELSSLSSDFILDGELILYAEESIQGLNHVYKKGEKIERIDMKSFLKDTPAGKYTPVYYVFDIVFKDGKELFELPLIERKKILNQTLQGNLKKVKKVQSELVKSKEELFKEVKKASAKDYSEGAMVKVANSSYAKSGRTSFWAKVKNYKELVVKVQKVIRTKSGAYIGECILSDGTYIGKTYATALPLKPEDIIEVRVAEVKYENGKFSWDNPIVHSIKPQGTSLTTPEEAKAIAKIKRQVALAEDILDGLVDLIAEVELE